MDGMIGRSALLLDQSRRGGRHRGLPVRCAAMSAARVLLDRLIDDAGLFPPARKPMARAVADHHEARAGAHAWMLGRFLCPVSRLDELSSAGPEPAWRIGAICDGADWRADLETIAAYRGPGALDAVELRLPAEPVGVVLDAMPASVEVFVEIAAGDRRAATAALEDLSADGRAGAKIRCGGLAPEAFPADGDVAHFLRECGRLRLPFKATAGLHHPFRVRDASLRVLQHGFVNLLAAAALPEADPEPIVAEADPSAFSLAGESLRWRDRVADADMLRHARALFTGYGSCSFDEPVADLVAHGVLEAEASRA
jgi:hypothetical protein